ncbi:hypothetical protein K501DRAFT_177026 [Backusella circina FSU 941]|nr:hypothetical protein K501DRAFT_177026 [Backusella circina FSU 941]
MVMLLFIAIVYAVIEPANFQDLNISEEQAPVLLKNAHYLTADQTKFIYKPYSLFGEQLSHISEEESQLDRVFTAEDSLGRVTSYASTTPSYHSNGLLHHNYSSRHDEVMVCVHSSALAALPLPVSTDPLTALWTAGDEMVYYTVTKRDRWKYQTLKLTLLLLGINYGLINTFLTAYFYIMLEMSIPLISVYIILQIVGDMMVSKVIEKWFIQRLNLTVVTTCAHITLILCAMMYPILKPNSIVTQFVLVLLQLSQAIAFQLMWLSGSYDVNDFSYNYYDHIKQQARLSAIYSSIGPAFGVLLAGYFLHGDSTLKDYSLIFKVAVALFSSSFVFSWGWTSDD